MKISKETINILKSFSQINDSIIFDEPRYLKTKSPGSSSIIGIAEIEEEIPEAAIYSLNNLIASISLFEEEIDYKFTKDYLYLNGDKTKIKFRLSNPDHVQMNLKKVADYKKYDDFQCSFTLSKNELINIKKASKIIDANVLKFESDGKVCKISLINSEMDLSNTYEVEIEEVTGSGSARLFVDNLDIIYGDYDVKISTDKVVKFTIKNQPNEIFYFISCLV